MTARGTILIVGNGGAAANAIWAARKAGYEGDLHLVSDTRGPVFNPMLAPHYLAGQTSYKNCFPFEASFYKTHKAVCHFGSKAEFLDTENRICVLQDGTKIHYDQCLVATGASPEIPSVSGLKGSRHAMVLRTPEQTERLEQALYFTRSAVILGGSLVGTKLASILIGRGIKVILAELADRVLSTASHPACSSFIKRFLVENGVNLLLNVKLEGVEDLKEGITLHFEGRDMLRAGVCLVCTGVRTNMDMLEGSDVHVDQGILVDSYMRTSAAGLYAAGDVSQGRNLLSGKKEVIGLWGNACGQGRAAGLNIAGQTVSYPGYLPQYATEFFGANFISLGNAQQQGKEVRVLARGNPSRPCFRLLVMDQGVLVGANLLNCFHGVGHIKAAIIQKLEWREGRGHYGFRPFWREGTSIPSHCVGVCRALSLDDTLFYSPGNGTQNA